MYRIKTFIKKNQKILLIILLAGLLSFLFTYIFNKQVVRFESKDVFYLTIFENSNGNERKYQRYLYQEAAPIVIHKRLNIVINFIIILFLFIFIIYRYIYKKDKNNKSDITGILLFIYFIFLFQITTILDLVMSICFFAPYFIIHRKKDKHATIIAALIIWSISVVFIEPITFAIKPETLDTCVILAHISYFEFLLFVTDFVKHFIKHRNDVFYKRWIVYASILFVINIIVLVLTWPGNFIWDEMSIFYYAEYFMLNNWQSYLMQLVYTWSLFIIPVIVGIEFFLITVSSLIFGYILSKAELIYKTKLLPIIMIIIISSPAIILNIQYPLRHSIYTSFEVLLLSKIFFSIKEEKSIKNNELYFYSFMIVLIAFWRTEGILYLIMIPLIFLLKFKKKFLNKKMLVKFLLCILLFGFMYLPFKILTKKYPDVYLLTMFVNPLSNMLQYDINVSDKDLQNIDNVLDVEVLKEHPCYTESMAFNFGVIKEDYRNHMKPFIISYAKIVLKNPITFVKVRFKTYLATSSLDPDNVSNSPWGIYKEFPDGDNLYISNMWNNDIFSKPYDIDFHFKSIKFLKGVKLNEDKYNLFGKIVWNFTPALLLICFLIVYYLFNKKIYYSLLLIVPILKAIIVFISAPACYFFYYYNIYILGYLLFGVLIYKFIDYILKNKNNSNKQIKINHLLKQALSFFMISGIGWLMDMCIYTVLTKIGVHVVLSNIVSSTVAVTYVYITSTNKLFKNNSKINLKVKYCMYVIYQIFIILVASYLVYLISNGLKTMVMNIDNYNSINYLMLILNNCKLVAKILITPFTMVINFLFMKLLIERI